MDSAENAMPKKSLKSLASTYIFREYDKTLKLTNNIVRLTTEGKFISEEDIKDNIMEIERRYYFSSKNLVLSDFRNGTVKLLFNDNPTYRLPNTIPSFLINTGNAISCVVNLSNYAKKDKDGNLLIDTRMLFCLMQSGSILARCYKDYSFLINKTQIIKSGSAMYSKLFTKVLNKMYSININPERQDLIVYLSSYFFIVNVLGRNSDSLIEMNKKYAIDNCKATSKLIIDDTMYKFKPEDFNDINSFITAISKNVYGLSDLTTRAFIDNYISSYGPLMMLGLEFLPIFLHNMFSVVVGAFVNNQHILETTLGKDIDDLFKAFFY